MSRERILPLVIGIALVVAGLALSYAGFRRWIPEEVSLGAVGIITVGTLLIRSPQEKPFPAPKSGGSDA